MKRWEEMTLAQLLAEARKELDALQEAQTKLQMGLSRLGAVVNLAQREMEK